MRISNKNQMPQDATKALGQENKAMRRAVGSTSFRLTLTGNPPKVSTDEIRRMLLSARGSDSYKANFHNYQFKLNGQKLILKEQGFFSKLVGRFKCGREILETRRANAARLIGEAFNREHKMLMTSENHFAGRMTKAESIRFQRDVMNHSDVSPKARELRTNQGVVVAPAIDDNPNANGDSGPITFDDLMTGRLERPNDSRERRHAVRDTSEDFPSFAPYKSEVDAPKDSLIQANRPRASEGSDDWQGAGRDSSFIDPFPDNSYKNLLRSSNGSLGMDDSSIELFRRLLADH